MSNAAERLDAPLSPLERVLQRLGGASGFPALTQNIMDINRIVASDSESVGKLTQTILRDVAMTNKLLHLVNSATYGQFRGHIHTISKAVLILGFEAVRNIASGLIMLEFTKGRSQAKALEDEIVASYFAGVVSRNLCQKLALRTYEEVAICTMFQNLGRLITIFFLFEDCEKIRQLMAAGLTEDEAAEKVLGLPYRELGIGIARHWNFPDRLLHGMQALGPRDLVPPKTDADKLKLAANLANELCAAAMSSNEGDKQSTLLALTRRYQPAIKVDSKELCDAIEYGLTEFSEQAPTLQLPVRNSPAITTIRAWIGQPEMTDEAGDAAADVAALAAPAAVLEESPEAILSDGIRDVTETLVSDFALNDVLQMVLETMHRGLSFRRTLIFIRDNKRHSMRARHGLGEQIEQLLPECAFPTAFAPDVFHVALNKGVDIVIEDTAATNIVSRIPAWYQQVLHARSFLLMPVMVNNKAIGLLYADAGNEQAIKVDAKQLDLLRTLRSQLILAIKQKL